MLLLGSSALVDCVLGRVHAFALCSALQLASLLPRLARPGTNPSPIMPVAQRQAAGERSGGLYPPASTKSNWRWMCLQAMEQVAARQQLGANGDDGVDLAVQAPPPPHW